MAPYAEAIAAPSADMSAGHIRLVHICGFPSSGTDLLANFMSAHPDICVRGEFPMLARLAREFGATVSREEADDLVKKLLASDVYGNFANRAPRLDDLAHGRDRIEVAEIYMAMLTSRDIMWCGNKTPQNTENMDALLSLFPETRFVFIVRDIRDVCLSWRRKWGKDIYLCAAKWNARMAKGLRMIEALPKDRVLQLRFEDLVTDPASVGRKVSEFLGLPYDEIFLNYHLQVRAAPDGKKNFGEPIKASSQGNWRGKLTPAETRRIEEVAYPMMIRLGYSPEFAGQARPLTAVGLLAGLAADAWAMFVVGNRYRRHNGIGHRLRKVGVAMRYRMPFA